ncbi:OR4 protein, partial [Acromyrmex charruanus]
MVDRKQEKTLNTLAANVTKQNELHVSDFYYAIQISICLLKPFGAWPLANDETSKFKIVLHRASMVIATFLLIFIVVSMMLHMMKEKDVFLIIHLMCELLFTLMAFAKYVLLLWHQDRLRFCIDYVANDWRYAIIEDRDIMLANARLGRTFGITSVVFMFSCGTMYYLQPIVTPNLVNEDNVTVRSHPSACEFLVFDSKVSPVYEIVYFLQVLSGLTAYSAFCGICSLMANFVAHVCGQCDVLISLLEELVDGGKRNSGSIDNRIALIITRHLHLLRFVSHVRNLFTEICLVEFMNASCNICLLGYIIITDMNNNESFLQIFMYFFGLVSVIFNVFMFCYIGDLLKERCQQIGTICYTIEWYRMPSRKAIDLLMPIAISRYSATLTAGKMLTMTLTTFSDVSNTASCSKCLMIPNEYQETDVKYVFEQSHVVLRMLGIWPLIDRQPNIIEKIINIFLVIVCYLLLHCDMVPGILYYAVVDDEPSEKVKMMPPILYSVMAIAKYSTLLVHEYDIRSCLRHIKEDWGTIVVDDAREVMLSKASNGRRLFTLCCTFMYCGGLSYNTIVPLSRGSIVIDENITIRPFSSPGYYVFFDPQNSPAYEIVFLQQVLCGFVMYTITVAICGLAAVFVMHACAQMEILMRQIENLVDESEFGQRNISAKLAIIVEHQIRIQNFLQLVENVLRYSSLVEIVGCTTLMCLTGYCIIGEWDNRNLPAFCTYVTALTSVIINIFILCYIGEYVTAQAEEVGLITCTLDWYRLPTNVARDMILVIISSNIPPRITAGKFIELSFKTFGDVIKSAVIYLNILRQLTE